MFQLKGDSMAIVADRFSPTSDGVLALTCFCVDTRYSRILSREKRGVRVTARETHAGILPGSRREAGALAWMMAWSCSPWCGQRHSVNRGSNRCWGAKLQAGLTVNRVREPLALVSRWPRVHEIAGPEMKHLFGGTFQRPTNKQHPPAGVNTCQEPVLAQALPERLSCAQQLVSAG